MTWRSACVMAVGIDGNNLSQMVLPMLTFLFYDLLGMAGPWTTGTATGVLNIFKYHFSIPLNS